MDVAIIDIPWNGIWLGMKIAAMAESYETNVAPRRCMQSYRGGYIEGASPR